MISYTLEVCTVLAENILWYYKESDHVITILNHNLMTKKHLLCILLIVQILVFLYKDKGAYSSFVVPIVHFPFVSYLNILKVFHFI